MLPALVISLIVNLLLGIWLRGYRYEAGWWKTECRRCMDGWNKANDTNLDVSKLLSRAEVTINIQAKRLLDIQKLTQT